MAAVPHIITETPRTVLRAWTPQDAEPFAAMGRDPEVMRFLGPLLTPAQSQDAADRQNALITQGQPAFWAMERKDDGAFLGFVGVKAINFETDFTPGYEIGWRLARSHWGRGYASEAAKAALRAAFSEWDMPEIYSFTVTDNTASQRVMQRIGMTRVNGGDFDHPNLAKEDSLSRHVLYKITRSEVL